MAPVSGTGTPKKKAPDEARLQEAEKLKGDYERLYEEGRYSEAAALAKRACAILEKESGDTLVAFADCINDLGLIYAVQGAHRKAEALLEHALAICEKVLGPNHPDVALSLNNLAVLYGDQGAYGKAKALHE